MKTRSRQKELLLEIFSSLPQGQHISAQELRDRVVKTGGEVSLSTIYRALDRLSDEGEIRSIMSARGQLWEAVVAEDHHDHLICTKCGLTIEFHDDLLSGFGRSVAERKGYEYQESRFDIFGFCKDCKEYLDNATVMHVSTVLENIGSLLEAGRKLIEKSSRSLAEDKDRNVGAEIEKARMLLKESLEECNKALGLLDYDL